MEQSPLKNLFIARYTLSNTRTRARRNSVTFTPAVHKPIIRITTFILAILASEINKSTIRDNMTFTFTTLTRLSTRGNSTRTYFTSPTPTTLSTNTLPPIKQNKPYRLTIRRIHQPQLRIIPPPHHSPQHHKH